MQTYRLFRVFLTGLLFLLPVVGNAVTLGEARVNSYLNQPLDVEIDLIGLAPGQRENLRLRIANQEYFDRLGISYSRLLAYLDFDVVRSGDQWVVRARTNQAITEPFLDFPLQMNWPGGQMIKQFTLLLDPPPSIRPARAAQTSRAREPIAPRTAPVAAASTSPEGDYGPVRNGETLWPIAKKLQPRGITTRQMAMALLRANPQAFINGDINMLKAGAVLTIPSLAFIQEIDAKTARAQFNAATQPQRSRPPVVAAPPPAAATPAAGAAGSSTGPAVAGQTPVDPEQVPQESQAQLRIIGDTDESGPEVDSEEDLKERLLVTMEEIESNRLTTDAIESRLANLEAELERMQELVSLKDAQIEALQSEVAARDDIRTAARASEPTPAAAAVPPAAPTSSTPDPNELEIGIDTEPVIAAAPAAVVAPTPVTSIDAVTPAANAVDTTRPWYERHLWMTWVALAVLGMAVLLLMFRRPQVVPGEPEPAELPAVAATAAAAKPEPKPAEMRTAEEDLKALADAHLPAREEDTAEALDDLPDLEITQIANGDDHGETDDITDSVLAEMLEESRLVPESADPATGTSDFNDDDIASWIKELDSDADPRSANDEKLSEEEIPSILTELDDQLTSPGTTEFEADSNLRLEPVEDTAAAQAMEDDTFTMSLDLARAYLEIGDQEGAKDMLKQALAGARDPDHRRQIEELLQQID